MSEIFLQNIENEHFHNFTRKHKIRLLARYLDDILVIYDSVTSNENYILNDLNKIHNKIKRKVLTRRREYGTYLATARRHRRRLKMQKRDE